MDHPQPQTPEDKLVALPGALLLIVFSLVCKSDIKEVHGNLSNPFLGKNVRGQGYVLPQLSCGGDAAKNINVIQGVWQVVLQNWSEL